MCGVSCDVVASLGTGYAALIRDNLQEIYHAAHSEWDRLNLVANFSGTRIYDSTRGWGRAWCWFYRAASWITGKNQRFHKLKVAILRTHSLFQHQLLHIHKDLERYESYLALAGGGYNVVEDDFHGVRKAISLWHSSHAPFIKSLDDLKHPKLEKLFHICFAEKNPRPSMAVLWSDPELIALDGCHKIIDLEGLSQEPLPLEIFKKIIRKKNLNILDDKRLESWIKKINRCPASVNLVHEAMQAIAARYIKPARDGNASLADPSALEVYLEDKGCTIFKQHDPQHIAWRHKLTKDASLSCQGQELVLDAQIQPAKSHVDNTLVFSIQNQPQYVVLIAQNRAALGMKRCRQKLGNGFGVELVHMLDIANEGRWSLAERLKPVNSRKWMIQPGGGFSKEDEAAINELAMLLGWLVKQNCTPLDFAPESIMFDKDSHLKALRPLSRKAFDFNALEDFAVQCAAGNLAVFQLLMAKSGLVNHPIAHFYNELVAATLKGDKTTVGDLAAIHKIVDPEVVDRGAALRRDVLELRAKLSMKVRECQPDKDIQLIEKEGTAYLCKFYQNTHSAGILWPSLGEDVLEKM